MSQDIFKHLNDQFQTVFNAPSDEENLGVIKVYKGFPPESAEDPVNEDNLIGEFVPSRLMETDLELQQATTVSEFNEEYIKWVAAEICKITELEIKKAMMR